MEITPKTMKKLERKFWHDVKKATGIAALISSASSLILFHDFFPILTVPVFTIIATIATFCISTYIYTSKLATRYPDLLDTSDAPFLFKKAYPGQFDPLDPSDQDDPAHWKIPWEMDPAHPNSLCNPLNPAAPNYYKKVLDND